MSTRKSARHHTTFRTSGGGTTIARRQGPKKITIYGPYRRSKSGR